MQLLNNIKNKNSKRNQQWDFKWIRPLKWVLAAVLIFGLSKMGVDYKHKQTIQNLVIQIDGADPQNVLLKEDVLAQIEESFGFDLTGSKIQLLDLENIEKVVEQYDFVKSTDVYLDAENNIHVDIVQRTPLVRVFDKSGAHYYMDDAGFKIEADGDIRARVLVVNGIVGPYERDEEGYLLGGLHDVFLLASKIDSDPFMKSLIEQVYVKNNYEMVLFPKIGKEHIQFGRATDIEVKFKRLKNFYEGGIRYKGWNKYKEINLRYKDQVITKESA
jgi:cell division protein FtsQ